MGAEKLELFLMDVIQCPFLLDNSASKLIFSSSDLVTYLLWGIGQVTLFFWASLLFARREITILSRLFCRVTVTQHSINAGFYDVIEPRHYLPSIKTLSYMLMHQYNSFSCPRLRPVLLIDLWPQLFCTWLVYSLNHANVTIFLQLLDFKWITAYYLLGIILQLVTITIYFLYFHLKS